MNDTANKADARAQRIAQARADLARRYSDNPGSVDRIHGRMSVIEAARKRERQRVEHLVLGQPRPMVTVVKRVGRRKPKNVRVPAELEPSIEAAVQRRERWSFRAAATSETMHHAAGTHQDCLIQMQRNGTIDSTQLGWAAEIANVYRSIESEVGVKVASLEARVDQSRGGRSLVGEGIHRVRMHLAYRYWRDLLPAPKQMVLDMIVSDNIGYTVAARRYGVHKRKAKRLLIEALNRWPECVAVTQRVDRNLCQQMNAGCPPDADRWWAEAPHIRVPSSVQPVIIGTDLSSGPDITTTRSIDPEYLDERGYVLPWSEIAEIIRAKIFAEKV